MQRPLVALAGSILVASAIAILFVLPAEYGLDWTGFGRWSGLARMGAKQETPALETDASTSRTYVRPFRSDTLEIRLAARRDPKHGDELEYKVSMQAGESLVYTWKVEGLDDEEFFYSDLHGEQRGQGTPVVVEYRKGTGLSANGLLVAAMDGVHGWYLQNQSDRPVVVHLRLSGFYELVPPGAYGNEAGILPVRP